MSYFLGGYICQITSKSNQHFAMSHEKAEHMQDGNETGVMGIFHKADQP